MVLPDDQIAGLFCRFLHQLLIERFYCKHVDHTHIQPELLRLLVDLQGIVNHFAAGDNGQVVSFAGSKAFSDLKHILCCIEDSVLLARVNPDRERPVVIQTLFDNLAELNRIGSCADRHVDKGRIQRHILHRVVRGSAVSGQAGIVRDDTDRQVRIADVRADLLQRTHAHKRHHSDDKRDISFICKPGRDADDTLLRYSGINKAVRMFFLKSLAAETDIRRHQPHTRVLIAKGFYGITYDGSGGVILIKCIRLFHASISFLCRS